MYFFHCCWGSKDNQCAFKSSQNGYADPAANLLHQTGTEHSLNTHLQWHWAKSILWSIPTYKPITSAQLG